MYKRATMEEQELRFEIEDMKKELDGMLDKGENCNELLDISEKLDVLIARYYSLPGILEGK